MTLRRISLSCSRQKCHYRGSHIYRCEFDVSKRYRNIKLISGPCDVVAIHFVPYGGIHRYYKDDLHLLNKILQFHSIFLDPTKYNTWYFVKLIIIEDHHTLDSCKNVTIEYEEEIANGNNIETFTLRGIWHKDIKNFYKIIHNNDRSESYMNDIYMDFIYFRHHPAYSITLSYFDENDNTWRYYSAKNYFKITLKDATYMVVSLKYRYIDSLEKLKNILLHGPSIIINKGTNFKIMYSTYSQDSLDELLSWGIRGFVWRTCE